MDKSAERSMAPSPLPQKNLSGILHHVQALRSTGSPAVPPAPTLGSGTQMLNTVGTTQFRSCSVIVTTQDRVLGSLRLFLPVEGEPSEEQRLHFFPGLSTAPHSQEVLSERRLDPLP